MTEPTVPESDPPTVAAKTVTSPHSLEWIPVGLLVGLAGALLWRHFHPTFLSGQLLPALTLGLLPGSVIRLLGKPSLAAHRVGVAGGLVAFMFANGTISLEPILAAAARPVPLLTGTMLVLLIPLLGAWRWRLLLAAQDLHLSFIESLRLGLVGYFFNNFVPGSTGGDIFRAYSVTRGRGKMEAAVTTVILDRLLGLPPLIFLIVIAAASNWKLFTGTPAFHAYAWATGIAMTISSIFFGLILLGGLVGNERLLRWEEGLPGGAMLAKACRAIGAYRQSKKTLGKALLIGLVAHILTIAACLQFGQAVGMERIDARQYALLVPLGLMVNAIPATPGGVGQGEYAFGMLFAAASPAPDKSISPKESANSRPPKNSVQSRNRLRGAAVMLCYRAGLILCSLLGGILYALGRHDLEKEVASEETSRLNQ